MSQTKPTKLQEILEDLWSDGYFSGDNSENEKEATAEAHQAISDLINEIIGEDEPLPLSPSGYRRAKIRNELRAEIKANLKQRGIGE